MNDTWLEYNSTDDLILDEIDDAIEPETKYHQQINPIIIVAIGTVILALPADAITIYIVRRFKRLWKQHHNTYIFHEAIMNLIKNIFFIILLTLEIYIKTHNITPWSYHPWLLMFTDIIMSFLLAQTCLMIFMTIDWYLFVFHPSNSTKFRKVTTILITSCYLYAFIVTFYYFASVIVNSLPGSLSLFLLGILYVICLILLIIFGVIYLCRRKGTRAGAFVLKVSILKFFIWLPFLITVFCGVFLFHGLYYLAVSLLAVSLLTPVVQLFMFYVWDRNFKAALSRMFDCGKNVDAEDIDHYLEESVEEGAMVYDASNGQVQHHVN